MRVAIVNWPMPAGRPGSFPPPEITLQHRVPGQVLRQGKDLGLRAWGVLSPGHVEGVSGSLREGGDTALPMLGEPLGFGTSRNGRPWRSLA